MFARRMLVPIAALALSAPVWAQDSDDGPGRGVARISVLNGDVSVRRGDSGDNVAAALNAPLVVQDHVYTGPGSRTELQFDWANMLRVGSNSEVRLAELEHRRYMVQVARGTVTWRVLRDQEAYAEISTPTVSVRPVRRGIYRVTVQQDGTSEITVRSGEAEIFTPRGSERLRAGRTMVARGTAADPEYRIVSEIAEDEWDRWNVHRDRDLERSRTYSYVSRDIYGAEDLDNHGDWVYAPQYGWVWAPRVAAGWAPYRYGRWTWLDWYGWNWVSYDPWGWAPYHYGRWFWHGPRGWCWWPGSIRARHYWSPALVAFFGFGNVGVGIGVGGGWGWGHVGWIPLAPYDPFHRWWGPRWYGGFRNYGYVGNRVTVVNNVNITNVYRNARIGNAVTAVDRDGFSRGRVGNVVRVTDSDFARASVAQGPLPIAPARESLRLADRESTVRVAEGRRSDAFFSNRRPAQVERVSFEEQRSGIEQIARRSLGGEAGGRTADVAERGSRAVDAGSADTGRGWRRVGETSRGADQVNRSGFAAGSRTADADVGRGGRGADSEWRSFGSARAAEGRGADGSGAGVGRAPDVESGRSGRGADSGWRSFGSARTGEPARSPEAVGGTVGRGADSGWRGFGSARTGGSEPGSAPGDAGITGNRSSDAWSRFGERTARPADSDSVRRDTGTRPAESRGEWRSEPRGWDRPSRSDGSRSSGESIRISPPIVRERGGDYGGARSAPSWGGGSRGGDYSGGRSSPSWGGSSRGSDSGGGRSAPSWGGGSRGGDIGGDRSSGGGGGRSAPSGGGSRGADGGGGRSSGGGGRGR